MGVARLGVVLSLMSLGTSLLALPSNSIRLIDLTGSATSNQPISLPRYFADGDVCTGYPKPRINGTAPTNWQTDIKSVWPSGCIQFAIISFKYSIANGNGTDTIDFVSDATRCSDGTCTALNQAGILAFNAGSGTSNWDTQIELTAAAVTKTANVRTMITAGKWSYWLQGNVVTKIIVEDNTALSPYLMGWQYVGGGAGGMSVNAGAQYQSLRPRFVVTCYAGWPGIKVESIIENVGATTWQDQIYNLVVKTGTPSLAARYTVNGLLHNIATRWSKPLWIGSEPATPDNGTLHIDFNRVYLEASGIVPPFHLVTVPESQATLDYNAYLTRCAALYQGTTACDVLGVLGHQGDYNQAENKLAQTPEVRFFHLMSATSSTAPLAANKEWRTLNGDETCNFGAGCLGLWDHVEGFQVSVRETSATVGALAFCSKNCTSILGDNGSANNTATALLRFESADTPTVVGGRSTLRRTTSPWVGLTTSTGSAQSTRGVNGQDSAHFPAYPWGYLMTGDPYRLEHLNFHIMWVILHGDAPGKSSNTSRGDDWAYISTGEDIRGVAWASMYLNWSSILNPQYCVGLACVDTPERQYFKQVFTNNMAVQLGRFNQRVTSLYQPAGTPCSNGTFSRWEFGCVTARPAWAFGGNPMGIFLDLATPSTAFVQRGGLMNAVITTGFDHIWMMEYDQAWKGWAYQANTLDATTQSALGYIRKATGGFLTHFVLDPQSNPFRFDSYPTGFNLNAASNVPIRVTGITQNGTNFTVTLATGHAYTAADNIGICCHNSLAWKANDWFFGPANGSVRVGGACTPSPCLATQFQFTNSSAGALPGWAEGTNVQVAKMTKGNFIQSALDFRNTFSPGAVNSTEDRDWFHWGGVTGSATGTSCRVCNYEEGYPHWTHAALALSADLDYTADNPSDTYSGTNPFTAVCPAPSRPGHYYGLDAYTCVQYHLAHTEVPGFDLTNYNTLPAQYLDPAPQSFPTPVGTTINGVTIGAGVVK